MPTPDDGAAAMSEWEAGLGADLSLGIGTGGDLRLGAWAEAPTSTGLVGGAELLIGAAPAKLDLFQYRGEGVLALRLGGNDDVLTGAVAYGYRAPWALWGPWRGTTRYMIGVRLVATATRARADSDDWAMTVGLEFEPIGSVRYLFGVRSWY